MPLTDDANPFSFLNLGRKKPRRDPHYATFNRRMMAITVDSFFLLLFEPLFDSLTPIDQEALGSINADLNDPNFGSQAVMQILSNHEFIYSWLANLGLQIFVFCLFSAVCWHFWSATPGKMLFRIKIVDAATEQPISDKQIILRVLGYWISCIPALLGILWIGIDKKKRGWHDFMAGTVVVTIPWKKKKDVEEPYGETITY